MQAHGIVCGLMQDKRDKIKSHYLLKLAGQLVEEGWQLAVCDDCFRHGEQSPVRVISGDCLTIRVSMCHRQRLSEQSNSMPSMTLRILAASRIAHGTSSCRSICL